MKWQASLNIFTLSASSCSCLGCVEAGAKTQWLGDDAQVAAVANMLDIAISDVEGVATFFNRIYRSPVGEHVILICDSVACYLGL